MGDTSTLEQDNKSIIFVILVSDFLGIRQKAQVLANVKKGTTWKHGPSPASFSSVAPKLWINLDPNLKSVIKAQFCILACCMLFSFVCLKPAQLTLCTQHGLVKLSVSLEHPMARSHISMWILFALYSPQFCGFCNCYFTSGVSLEFQIQHLQELKME